MNNQNKKSYIVAYVAAALFVGASFYFVNHYRSSCMVNNQSAVFMDVRKNITDSDEHLIDSLGKTVLLTNKAVYTTEWDYTFTYKAKPESIINYTDKIVTIRNNDNTYSIIGKKRGKMLVLEGIDTEDLIANSIEANSFEKEQEEAEDHSDDNSTIAPQTADIVTNIGIDLKTDLQTTEHPIILHIVYKSDYLYFFTLSPISNETRGVYCTRYNLAEGGFETIKLILEHKDIVDLAGYEETLYIACADQSIYRLSEEDGESCIAENVTRVFFHPLHQSIYRILYTQDGNTRDIFDYYVEEAKLSRVYMPHDESTDEIRNLVATSDETLVVMNNNNSYYGNPQSLTSCSPDASEKIDKKIIKITSDDTNIVYIGTDDRMYVHYKSYHEGK